MLRINFYTSRVKETFFLYIKHQPSYDVPDPNTFWVKFLLFLDDSGGCDTHNGQREITPMIKIELGWVIIYGFDTHV